MHTLILFDIDGTLVLGKGAGLRAMARAAAALFGRPFETAGVALSGRLDPHIWRDLAKLNGVTDPERWEARFRKGYAAHLAEIIDAEKCMQALPGAGRLVAVLQQIDTVTLGLLTGNYPETGRLKIRSAGLDPSAFIVSAWGCDGASRRDLPRVAMRRFKAHTGQSITAGDVVIVGDAPLDVDCALFNGCRILAVATGRSSTAELLGLGAHRAVECLTDIADIGSWLTAEQGVDDW